MAEPEKRGAGSSTRNAVGVSTRKFFKESSFEERGRSQAEIFASRISRDFQLCGQVESFIKAETRRQDGLKQLTESINVIDVRKNAASSSRQVRFGVCVIRADFACIIRGWSSTSERRKPTEGCTSSFRLGVARRLLTASLQITSYSLPETARAAEVSHGRLLQSRRRLSAYVRGFLFCLVNSRIILG
eukprot:2400788-Rhodomonas_salina.2